MRGNAYEKGILFLYLGHTVITFLQWLYQIHIFALMKDNSGAPAEHGRFVMLYSSVDQVIMTARTTLPRHAFSNLYSKKGTYEAVITVGLIPLD